MKTVSCGTATITTFDGSHHVLLVRPRESSKEWGFPKGRMEQGENEEQTAIRETYEETGVAVSLVCDEPIGQVTLSLKNEEKTVKIYLAVPNASDVDPLPLDGENCEVAWWPLSSPPKLHRSQWGIYKKLYNAVAKSV